MSLAEPTHTPADADFEQARELFLRPPAVKFSSSLLTISLILFVGLGLLGSNGSFADLGLLVGVIFVHELGHAIAMRISGYRNVQIFFIPLFGAAASGRRTNVAAWKQAIVLLAGPLPGIIAAYVIAVVGVAPELESLVWILVGLNVLNLLPIFPLDGGQLFRVLLFARHRVVEVVFMYVTAGVLVVGSLMLGEWVIAIFGALILVFAIPQRRRILGVAHQLRPLCLPADPAALDEDQTRVLHKTAWRMLPPKMEPLWRGKPQPQAESMLQILDAATQRAPSAGATIALFALWLAGWVLALATGAAMPPLDPPAVTRVDWMGQPIGGMRADMSSWEAIAACRATGGTAFPAVRTLNDVAIPTVVCDGSAVPLGTTRFTRVEVWYCGDQACVFELVSFVDADYVTTSTTLETLTGRKPRIIPTKPRCAPHDPPRCDRRYESSWEWTDHNGGTRLTFTLNDHPGDAPVYLSFASVDGMKIWR